jgi:hypothetical protein
MNAFKSQGLARGLNTFTNHLLTDFDIWQKLTVTSSSKEDVKFFS